MITDTFTLTNSERLAIRRALIAKGVKTAGLTDRELADRYGDLPMVDDATPASDAAAADDESAPEPTPTPTPTSGGNALSAAVAALSAALAETQAATVDVDMVRKLIAEHVAAPQAPINVTVSIADQPSPEPIEGAHCQLPEVMQWLATGEHLALVGPPASGKSTIAVQAAELLQRDYQICSAPQQEHKLFGFVDAGGTYHRTPFRECWENGGLLVIEEYDGGAPKVMLQLNNALAGDYCDFPDGTIKRSPDFQCVINGNTDGTGPSAEFAGRSKLDEATLDRFAYVHIGYDEALETRIVQSINPDALGWVQEVQRVRAAVAKLKIRKPITPRASIKGAKALLQGIPVARLRDALLYARMTADQRELVLREVSV